MVNKAFDEAEELDPQAVARANFGLAERLAKEGVTVAYDEDGDTLFITIGPGREALTEQLIDNVFIRVDPESLRVVGAVVLRFATDFLARNKIARIAFGEGFETLRSRGGTWKLEGADAAKMRPLFEAALTR